MKNWKKIFRIRMRMTNEEKFLIHWRTKNISTIFCSWIFLFLICHSVLTPWEPLLLLELVSLCRIPLMSHFFLILFYFIFGDESFYINCDNMLIFPTCMSLFSHLFTMSSFSIFLTSNKKKKKEYFRQNYNDGDDMQGSILYLFFVKWYLHCLCLIFKVIRK